ncbi:hypothetical protein Pcinc_034457, partial [Petrolisthes cinctipes]
GLALEGNDWTCECSLVWLGRWLRRWLRETLQIHTAMLKSAQQVHSLLREATCFDPRTEEHIPLLDLHSEDMGCQASALADSAPPFARSHAHARPPLSSCSCFSSWLHCVSCCWGPDSDS